MLLAYDLHDYGDTDLLHSHHSDVASTHPIGFNYLPRVYVLGSYVWMYHNLFDQQLCQSSDGICQATIASMANKCLPPIEGSGYLQRLSAKSFCLMMVKLISFCNFRHGNFLARPKSGGYPKVQQLTKVLAKTHQK